MRRTFHFVTVVLFMLVANIAHAAGPLGSQIVSRLYRDFAWEAVLSQPGVPTFIDQSKVTLRRYLTDELASALVADSACKNRRREICKLDFMPLWASQDPAAQDLAITQVNQGEVRVEYTAAPSQSKVILLFRVEQTKAGWRISDIVYPAGSSLARILAGAKE